MVVKKQGVKIRNSGKNSTGKTSRAKLRELNCYCYFCDFNEVKPHLHHIIRRQDGGRDSWNNLLPLCANHHESIHRRVYVLSFNPKTGLYFLRHRFKNEIIPPTIRQIVYPRKIPLTSIKYSHNLNISGDLKSKAIISIKNLERARSEAQKRRLKNLHGGVE